MDTWDEVKEAIKKEIADNRGAMTDLANYLGKTRQHVNSYINAGKTPNYDQAMEMRKWLEKRLKERG